MILITDYRINIINIVLDLLTMKLPLCSTWFLKVLISCYIINYFAYKLTKTKSYYIVLIVTVIYTILCVMLQIESKWYLTVYCYIVGMIIGNKKQYIIEKIYCMRLFKRVLLIFAILLCLTISILFNKFIIGKILFICLFSILFISSTLLFDINNKFLNFIGKYTLDIYLSHLGLIYIFDNIINNYDIKEIVFILLVAITVILKNKFFKIKFITEGRKINVEEKHC